MSQPKLSFLFFIVLHDMTMCLMFEGVKIFIDRKALMHVIGTEMDYVEDKLSSGFIFNNPNIKGTCGCGESFNIQYYTADRMYLKHLCVKAYFVSCKYPHLYIISRVDWQDLSVVDDISGKLKTTFYTMHFFNFLPSVFNVCLYKVCL